MREVVFRVLIERPGHLEARADGSGRRITAPTLDELHHEAREAVIDQYGTAHCTVRVRIRREPAVASSDIKPLNRSCVHGW